MSFEELNPLVGVQPAVDRYRKGMKELGRGLILLAILQLVAGLLVLPNAGLLGLLVLGMGVTDVVLGVLTTPGPTM